MKKSLLLACLCLAPALAVRGAGPKEEFIKHWKVSADFTIAVADAMPADKYDFRPNDTLEPVEMGFGKVMTHIAMANNSNFAMVAGMKAPAVPEKLAAAYKDPNGKFPKADVMQFLKDSFEFCDKALAAIDNDKLDSMTGPQGRQLSGHERLWSYFTHTAHHRGQAEVYLRVQNIRPPAYKF